MRKKNNLKERHVLRLQEQRNKKKRRKRIYLVLKEKTYKDFVYLREKNYIHTHTHQRKEKKKKQHVTNMFMARAK